MKNSVKKILSFVMIIAMAMLSLSMVAFASESAAATGTANTPNKQGSTGGAWLMIVIYILFFVVVGYFLIYRPNKKRKKQEEELRGSIILGDEVTTIGGIVGKVVAVKDDEDAFIIETGTDRVKMKIRKWGISSVDNRKPVDPKAEKKAKKEKEDK
jgi:preprotein translocase subunit YajC